MGRRSDVSKASRLAAVGLALVAGCLADGDQAGQLEATWGRRGLMRGQLLKPRAIAVDRSDDRIFLVDMRALIQAFTPDGEPLAAWETPAHEIGRPSGLALDRQGNLLVADSHYHQILVYDREGRLLRRYGGEPELLGDVEGIPLVGEFGYIGDVAVDSTGAIYVAEAQEHDRITRLSPSGEVLARWGGRGPAPGQFQRIRALAFDRDDNLYAADACNHRVQVFKPDGELIRIIGEPGSGLGQLSYPYDVAVAGDDTLYVCEYGSNRVQRFTLEGKSLGVWGTPGRGPGQLWNPWAVGVDSRGRVYVVDSNNHRVHRVRFD
jgi:sugar lactone lactonase YvrE